jgi:hypothetical protein
VRRHALGLLVAAALVALAASARADIYRWVDESGAVHYATDREAIPRAYRDAAQPIQKPPPRRAVRRAPAALQVVPAPSAAPEPAAPAPSGTPAPALEAAPPSPAAAPRPLPGPPSVRALPPDDPRAAEMAELEAQIARDRETLRELISTPRWDSAELANDPQIRELAERLPRLQAELEALRREPAP